MNFAFAAVPPKTSEDGRIDRYHHLLLENATPASRRHVSPTVGGAPPFAPKWILNAASRAPLPAKRAIPRAKQNEIANTTARAVIVARLGFVDPYYDMDPRMPTLEFNPRRRFHPIPSRCDPRPPRRRRCPSGTMQSFLLTAVEGAEDNKSLESGFKPCRDRNMRDIERWLADVGMGTAGRGFTVCLRLAGGVRLGSISVYAGHGKCVRGSQPNRTPPSPTAHGRGYQRGCFRCHRTSRTAHFGLKPFME